MYVESEIEKLYTWAESFEHSYFSYLDEYDNLYFRYLTLFSELEAVLGDREFETLMKLLHARDEMEKYCRLHYFREGVRLKRLEGGIDNDKARDI